MNSCRHGRRFFSQRTRNIFALKLNANFPTPHITQSLLLGIVATPSRPPASKAKIRGPSTSRAHSAKQVSDEATQKTDSPPSPAQLSDPGTHKSESGTTRPTIPDRPFLPTLLPASSSHHRIALPSSRLPYLSFGILPKKRRHLNSQNYHDHRYHSVTEQSAKHKSRDLER